MQPLPLLRFDTSDTGAFARGIPTQSVTAIKLSVYRNAKPQLGIRVYRAKLGLGVPSRADFTLNASKFNGSDAERGNDKTPFPSRCLGTSKHENAIYL